MSGLLESDMAGRHALEPMNGCASHNMAMLKARLDIASKFLPDFGLAAYCGFGRTPPTALPQILRDHLAALRIAGLAAS